MSDEHDPFSAAIPRDNDAERAVIGACLASSTAHDRARRIITAEDFYRPAHEVIWHAIAEVRDSGATADPITVLARLRERQDLTRIGGGPYIHELYAAAPITETVTEHARIVREASTRRRVIAEAQRLIQRASSGESEIGTLAADAVTSLTNVRDRDNTDIEPRYLAELLAEEDVYDWLVPGLLERGDRVVVVGTEGYGKSTLLRQMAICLAAGLHPFDLTSIGEPISVLAVDAENSAGTWRRKARPLVTAAGQATGKDPSWRVAVETPGRLDITTDRDLARLHALADTVEAEVLTIGPLYRLTPRAIQTDDEATPVLAALDTFRDRGITLMLEAHAGHTLGRGGERDLRPRGSSALLGWPEFGIGLRGDPDQPKHWTSIVKWRGDRDERDWPFRLKRGGAMPFETTSESYATAKRWTPHDVLEGVA